MDNTVTISLPCKHGADERECGLCKRDARIAALEAENEKLRSSPSPVVPRAVAILAIIRALVANTNATEEEASEVASTYLHDAADESEARAAEVRKEKP